MFFFQITKKPPRMITRLKPEIKDVFILFVIFGLSTNLSSGQNQDGK